MLQSDISVASMESVHLVQAQALSAAVGWPHRTEDWAFLLELGRGSVALQGDSVIGTIMWWPSGASSATLGMIIVAPERQGQGLGRYLMGSALAELGPRQVLLNATREGMPLYAKLGFKEVGTVVQHQGLPKAAAADMTPNGTLVRALQPEDLEAMIALDARASGLSREAMLRALASVGEGLVLERDSRLLGYALCRPFGRGHVIGPVAASDDQIAQSLISSWIKRRGDGFLRIDVQSPSGLSEWLVSLGLLKVDDVFTMSCGAMPSDRPQSPRLIALASQALG